MNPDTAMLTVTISVSDLATISIALKIGEGALRGCGSDSQADQMNLIENYLTTSFRPVP